MTIRQLELFTLVYELKNLTRAGEILYMTQSAVTQNLNKMEDEIGAQLLKRSNRSILPTPAGERFYNHAKRIIDEYNQALEELPHTAEALNFCYYPTPSSSVKDRILASIWEIDPDLPINQYDGRQGEITDNSRWLPNTLYLVPEEFIQDPTIHTITLAPFGHYIIMRDTNPLRLKTVILPQDLEGQTILVRSNVRNHHSHLKAAFAQLSEKGVAYHTAIAERAKDLIPKILSSGGIAILPEFLIGEAPGIVARPYDDGISTYLKLGYKGNLTPRVLKVLATLEERQGYSR